MAVVQEQRIIILLDEIHPPQSHLSTHALVQLANHDEYERGDDTEE